MLPQEDPSGPMACHSAQDTELGAVLQTHVAFWRHEIVKEKYPGKYSPSFRFHWYTHTHIHTGTLAVNLHRGGAAVGASAHYGLIWGASDALLEVCAGMRFAHPVWCVRQMGLDSSPWGWEAERDVCTSCCRFLPSLQPCKWRFGGIRMWCLTYPTTLYLCPEKSSSSLALGKACILRREGDHFFVWNNGVDAF